MLRHVEDLVATGAVRPGDRLPTERVLSETIGCSRGEVRRALARLETSGRVVRQVGRGTFLAERVGDTRVEGISPADLMAARLLWEPQVMTLATVTATDEDFAEMRRCLAGGDRADAYEDFEAWDLALHRSFAAATHNGVVMNMTGILHTSRNDPHWGGLKRRSFSTATCLLYRREHHAIVEALMDRNREVAQQAMLTHLHSIQEQVLG